MWRALCAGLLAVVLTAAHAAEHEITVNVDLVNIYFNVCNRKGRLIQDLRRESFTVFEDEKQQVITNFSQETDVPVTVALVIDTSGSVRDKLPFEKEAVIDFLQATLRRGRDKAVVFTFDSRVELQQDYTDDPALLSEAVRRTRAGGGTRMHDALHAVVQEKLSGQEERKAILLLTDGDDNSSRSSPWEVVETAQRNNVAIYAISVNALGIPLENAARADGFLEMFAAETGGKAFFPKGLKELSAYFKRISVELQSQYTIAYRSTNPKRDGTFRKIRIDVKDLHYSVRSRSGYYAPIQFTAG